MKLTKIIFYLEWPLSIEVINLRKYVMENLMKKGQVIRWSIIEIQHAEKNNDIRQLKIHAVLAN
tara:strand:- start:389 stop:580 length:192 start_codon:yes stop_codon:yes gene_type:complete